ncbi:MAG: Uma2 family endonuclease [Acidobacteria bacterium]|nr:Uma2 family endonuclease [Acidobacteriota bacterium]
MSSVVNPITQTSVSPGQRVLEAAEPRLAVPDHTMLPDRDGTFVKNFQEHPQSILLTETLRPVLSQRFPDGQYCIGQDSGIYWRLNMDPPERGAESPDWFLVVGVSPALDGKPRRSYVMWKEFIAPLIALEFVSGNGSEERDRTPLKGKFWIYEQALRIPFYGIYEPEKSIIEMHHLVDGTYRLLPPTELGRYVIEPLGVELGLWQGLYFGFDLPWMRWWSREGELLPTGDERAIRAEAEAKQAQAEREAAESRAQLFAEKLRELGIDPDTVGK